MGVTGMNAGKPEHGIQEYNRFITDCGICCLVVNMDTLLVSSSHWIWQQTSHAQNACSAGTDIRNVIFYAWPWNFWSARYIDVGPPWV